MKGRPVYVFGAIVVVFAVFAVFAVARIKTRKPPEKQIIEAMNMLSEARKENSPVYAKTEFNQAQSYYDSVMMEWNTQNEKFILFRNYSRISYLAEKSISSSKKAIIQAKKSIYNNREQLEKRMLQVKNILDSFEANFGNFPISQQHAARFSACKMQYSESERALETKQYESCAKKTGYHSGADESS